MTAPLSFHQERLWFIDQFERGNVYPASPTYHNVPLLLHGRGPVDPETFSAAVQALAGRHEAMRTRIAAGPDGPVQRVEPGAEVPVAVRDLGPGIGAAEAIEAAVAEAKRPFDLAAGLVRAACLRFGDGEFLLLLTLHHAIADKPSLRILAEELAALMRGESPPPPESQYPEYARWQRELPADVLEPLLFHWKWQLRGRLAALELPSARPRPAVHTFTEARHGFVWPPELAGALRAFAAREGADPADVTCAAFAALLHRYARQDEIVLGASEPCRRQPGTERLVGPVANLVVLRARLGGNPPFRAAVAELRRLRAQGREFQELPFDALVLALKPEKDMSRTALFDVLFGHDEAPAGAFALGPGLAARLVDTHLGFGKYDLNLSLAAGEDGSIAGILVYNADFHDAPFILQLAGHYERLLRAGLAAPETGIGTLPLLSPAEERRLLVDWNATAAAAPRGQTLHALFRAQAARTPQRIALSFETEQVTYAELDARSNRLAHRLRGQGVGAQSLVAVCLDRSVDLIVALIAVLKAGAAYLPLDPAYPRERLDFTIEDAGAAHLITAQPLEGRIGGGPPEPSEKRQNAASTPARTRMDADAAAIAAQPATPPEDTARPEHLAYCIYTSGSTGRPKGALIEHRQVVRLMINDRLPFEFGPEDVWTLFHSCCFDFSVWEMYGALLYGGRLVIVPRDLARDPDRFVELAARERVTVLNQTPTAFYRFAEAALRSAAPLSLREVIFGGEALLPLHLRAFAAAHPAIRLSNMYGITETTVHVTHRVVEAGDIAANRSNVGGPIPTTTVHLLDEHLQLVPPGVPGEICVGGEGVGRGYLRRDALTAERFVAHPYAPGERLYRSGDLARHLPDGTLIYLGRIDDQVQIRGFRVELGEIRTRLLRHPAVTAAEVIARPLNGAALELVAYFVPGGEVDPAALRRHLAEALPDYMVPAAIVAIAALPMTANGKVDREALPDPAAGPAAGAERAAPSTPAEAKLAALFAEVLRVDQVGATGHFFELGGHSLLATQLLGRVRAVFGVDLPLRHVFESPTVAALAAVITERAASGESLPAPAIVRAPRRPAAVP